jgi:hypothetical protein
MGVFVLCFSSCSIGEGIADFGGDLFEPDTLTYDAPGRKITDGSFSGMLVDPWGEKDPVIVAFRYLDDGPHLRMQPFDGSKGCDIGIAQRCIVFNKLDEQKQLVAVLTHTTQEGRGTLNFVNHDCEIVFGGIEGVMLPSRLYDDPPGYLVDGGDKLLDVNPWTGTIREISSAMQRWSQAPTEDTQVWFIEDGQFVAIDSSREELLRVGKDVTEVLGVSPAMASPFHLVEGGKLMKYDSPTAKPTLIAEDLCEVALGGAGYTYMSPCASRRLVTLNPSTGVAEAIDEGVGRVLSISVSGVAVTEGLGAEAIYTKPSATMPSADNVWLKQVGVAPRVWRENVARYLGGSIGASPTLRAVVDSNGTTGKLVRIDAAGETVLHGGVSINYAIADQGAFSYAMTNPSAVDGTLSAITTTGNTTTVAEKVSLETTMVSPAVDPEIEGVTDPEYFKLASLLYEFNDGLGKLGLLTRSDPNSLFELASDVPASRYEFFQDIPAIGYIKAWDRKAETGDLMIYNTKYETTSAISQNVVEFTELLWPYDGVLYTVRQGDDESIWIARAK